MKDERSDYRRGFDAGIDNAIQILETEALLTGVTNKAVKMALRMLRTDGVLAAEPNSVAREGGSDG